MPDKTIDVIVHNGVLYKAQVVDAPEADRIAEVNGFMYAEQLVRAYPNGTLLQLSHINRVIKVRSLEGK